MALTPKQKRFVSEYRKDLNATRAAKAAGYSKKTAKSIGQENLTKPDIIAALAEKENRLLALADITADRTLLEIARLAFGDLASFYLANGKIKPFNMLTSDQRACLAGCETIIKNAQAGDGVTDEVLKIKLWDKPKMLETLAKRFGMLTEKIEHSGEMVIRWEGDAD